MESQSAKRCPHFQIYSEPLAKEGPPSFLAIRHCILTERLIRIIRQTPEGNLLTQKLVVNDNFAFVGPDLEAVSHQACTVRRCEERCTPAYSQHLRHFGLEDPREPEVTCEDPEETADGQAIVAAEPDNAKAGTP